VADEVVRNLQTGERMTRKDYNELAQAIKSALEIPSDSKDREMFKWAFKCFLDNGGFEDYMREDNPRFDSERFREACGF
jgi:hypothetical protein